MKCPLCNQDICEEVFKEVDIGVGTQKFVIGYECQSCGEIEICLHCGAPHGVPHYSYCEELK